MNVKNRIDRCCRLIDNFGFVFTLQMIYCLFFKNERYYTNIIEKKLRDSYSKFLINNTFEEQLSVDYPCVWSLWWQGEEGMPNIVKICYYSQLKYVMDTGINYILLTKENIANYIDIPDFILEKVEKGQITLTHLSDIIRVLLLEQHGGMWLDLTLLFTKPINKSYFDYDFFSIKLDNEKYKPFGSGQCLTQCMWSGFCLSTAKKHSFLFRYLKESLLEYWSIHTTIIDYFIMNRLLKLAYNKDKYYKSIIERIPYSNPNLYILSPKINDQYEVDIFESLCEDTECFKLSYKMELNKYSSGNLTFYGYLCNLYM